MADEGTVAAQAGENNVASNAQGGSGDTQNAQEQNQQARPSMGSMIKTLLVRMFFIYLISSFFRRPSANQTTTTADGQQKVQPPSANIYMKNLPLDLYIYLSEQAKFTDFDNKDALFWAEEELLYGDWTSGPFSDGSYEMKGTIRASEALMNNGSIYLHCYIVQAGKSPNPRDRENYDKRHTLYRSKMLNRFKKRRFHTTVNLLTGEANAHPDLIKKTDDNKTEEILSHWHPNMTINLIEDFTPWVPGSVPAPLDEYIEFLPDGLHYKPILYFNDYWNMNNEYMPINDTTPELNLTLTFAPMTMFKWQMYAAQGMRNKWYSFLGEDAMTETDEDQDSIKTMLIETNPYLLGITVAVSIVHSIFEFLAFKNDIQFWKNRKSLEGLSVRSVFFNVFQSLIVLLYVLDNETNFMIKVSVFIGLGIELWKIQKVVDFKIDFENKWFGVVPRIRFEDKSTYTESNTRTYDQAAFRYLSWLLYPLLACYAIYSVIYLEHKSWYSWVLSMLYGFLLTFGFIMMTPQLFINYKLKSVAHLPWRMLTYKALNTFIDDLFAFVIKMPTLYRLGCFRDDIIFVIFLYQRYIYRIDPKRVNEFGVSAEMLEQAANGTLPDGEEAESTPAVDEGPVAEKSEDDKKKD